jgi:para-nitrobenzyl esterase
MLRADAFGPICPQIQAGAVAGSEDCLTLNVWAPRAPRELLPVLFFIHGGSHLHGSSGISFNGTTVYDGAELAQRARAVVVTVNYRLGVLGFLADQRLSRESGHGSGNYGYLDQLLALKWVRRNIAAFGGNPMSVTVFGQSAGGWSVAMMLASPLSEGLFARAIIHSGGTKVMDLKKSAENGAELARRAGCAGEADALACLRAKSAKGIVELLSGEGEARYGPTLDGYYLTERPLDAMKAGKHRHTPVLIGTVEEEMSVMGADQCPAIQTPEAYRSAVIKAAGPIVGPMLLSLYPVKDYATPCKAYQAISADSVFVCPARRMARALTASQKEFVGRFHFTRPFTTGAFPKFGASHGFELIYLFRSWGVASVKPSPDELALADGITRSWAEFARTGEAKWERYSVTRDNHLVLNAPIDEALVEEEGLRTRQCELWDRIAPE